MCDCYQAAPALSKSGVHTVCVDEMTGVQAKERIAPTKPMRPGQTEKVEFEYKRHGTQCLIGNFEVATGQVKILAYIGYHNRTRAKPYKWTYTGRSACGTRKPSALVAAEFSQRDLSK